MAKRRTAPERHVRNVDYTDRELLANIHASRDVDGYASTTQIALSLGFTGNGTKGHTPATKIASRLAWMRSGGLLESIGPDRTTPWDEPGSRDTRWRLTAIGHEIREGKLSRAVETALDKMDSGAQILLMRQLTRRGYVEGDTAVAFALRREYQHNIAQRKLIFR